MWLGSFGKAPCVTAHGGKADVARLMWRRAPSPVPRWRSRAALGKAAGSDHPLATPHSPANTAAVVQNSFLDAAKVFSYPSTAWWIWGGKPGSMPAKPRQMCELRAPT